MLFQGLLTYMDTSTTIFNKQRIVTQLVVSLVNVEQRQRAQFSTIQFHHILKRNFSRPTHTHVNVDNNR